MLVVVSQCGNRFGVVDTNDNVVEWVYDTDLYQYINNGVEIEGVSASGITVNPIYCVPYELLTFKGDTNIFEANPVVRKGYHNTAELRVNDVVYKVRALAFVSEGSRVVLKDYEFVSELEGILIKLSNGICTVLPDNLFNTLFTNIIDLSKIKG